MCCKKALCNKYLRYRTLRHHQGPIAVQFFVENLRRTSKKGRLEICISDLSFYMKSKGLRTPIVRPVLHKNQHDASPQRIIISAKFRLRSAYYKVQPATCGNDFDGQSPRETGEEKFCLFMRAQTVPSLQRRGNFTYQFFAGGFPVDGRDICDQAQQRHLLLCCHLFEHRQRVRVATRQA